MKTKKKRFEFGDKVWSDWTGNAIFYNYGVSDKEFPKFDANVFLDSQNESCGIESKELKHGWRKS